MPDQCQGIPVKVIYVILRNSGRPCGNDFYFTAFCKRAVEIEQLMWALFENRERLDEDTVSTIETNLRVIDRAIRSAREALEDDPQNAGLTRMLTSGRWKKMYDAMVKSVESGEPAKLVPFEEARAVRERRQPSS